MSNSLAEKAKKISFATIRVAAYVRRRYLRDRLEVLAVDLLDASAKSDFAEIEKVSGVLRTMIEFGATIYEIETVNAKILGAELSKLGEIGQSMRDERGSLDISKIFEDLSGSDKRSNRQSGWNRQSAMKSATLPDIVDRIADSESAIGNDIESAIGLPIPNALPNRQSAIGAIIADYDFASKFGVDRHKTEAGSGMIGIGTAIRQSAMLEKIRSLSTRDSSGQMVGCRMKDLVASFPDVSERTLRNDLQRLLGQGSIERLGNGGVASLYVIK